jgi:hypothetical protein
MKKLNGKEVDLNTLKFADVYGWDFPDFCDAYICEAKFTDGKDLTDEDIDTLNEDREFIYNNIFIK